MSTTFPQQLLEGELTVCVLEDCETIRKVYFDTRKKSTEESDYWYHPDFVKPLDAFLVSFKKRHSECKITRSEAREVLDKVFSEKSDVTD